jgi:hypothetical protein
MAEILSPQPINLPILYQTTTTNSRLPPVLVPILVQITYGRTCLFEMKQLLLAVVLTFQGAAHGKSALASWDDLRQIVPGTDIRAKMADGKTFRGQFQTASGDSLALSTANGQESLDRIRIARVQLLRRSHRLRDTLIGLGVGAGAGLGVGAALDRGTSCTVFCIGFPKLGKAIVTPVGAILGAGTGALIPTGGWKDVYRAP